MADLTGALQAAAGTAASAGGAADPNFNQTVLLLHGDGTNGAQNNTFLDSSTNNFTITRNGNTTQGTFSPFSLPNGEWSNFFDGTGDYLTAPDNVAYTFGTSDFTVEGWVFTGTSATQCLGGQGDSAGSLSSRSFLLYASISGNAVFSVGYSGNNSVTITSSTALPLNQWNHVAGVRDGATLRLYLNGVEAATGNISTASINDSGNPMTIGRPGDFNGEYLTGYCSNFRIVKGTCLYPSGTTFTPSTSPLTAISGTSLLTCQSNRFVDNSSNAFAITVNGNTSIQPFSPFAPSAAYSASVNGGSGYFDGSGDYLAVGSLSDWTFLHNGSDWTIEFWAYNTTSNFDTIVSTAAWSDLIGLSVYINLTTNCISVYFSRGVTGSEAAFTSNADLKTNQWNHVAITFENSGKTCSFYINGVAAGSSSNTGFAYSASNPTKTLAIGRGEGTSGGTPPGAEYTGYISSLRISTNIRTGLASIPSAPYTSDANTKLLTNFTNAGIFDNTGKNVLETVGNAQIDTGTKKYGTGALEFDGTGDYLKVLSSPNTTLSGDFTVEGWIYIPTLGDLYYLFGIGDGVTSSGLTMFITAGGKPRVLTNGGYAAEGSDGDVSAATWTHVALVRSGSTITIYIDGSSVDTGTVSATLSGTLYVNAEVYSGTLYVGVAGFTDDLRITKGVARYTSAFTPPTAAFPDL